MRRTSFYVGKIFGISLYIDITWFIIFFLVSLDLALRVFPSLHSEWSSMFTWVLALSSALLFFSSVLAHELAHALVARRKGIGIDRITLFLFGGVANMEQEPSTPKVEFQMAVAGPLVSLLIGVGCLFVVAYLPSANQFVAIDTVTYLSALSPAALVLAWLGTVNLFVGMFNLVPGYPLDGGRIARSFLWALTNNLQRATYIASWIGRGVAYVLIGVGFLMAVGFVFPVFGTGIGSGLWLVFIGWFLQMVAKESYRQVLIDELLKHVSVADIMRHGYVSIPPHTSVRELIDLKLSKNPSEIFVVIEDGGVVGYVLYEEVEKLANILPEKKEMKVSEIIHPVEEVKTFDPGTSVTIAYRTLATEQKEQLPVTDSSGVVGMIQLSDIVHLIQRHTRLIRSKNFFPKLT